MRRGNIWKRRKGRWHVFGRLSMLPTVAGIMMTALSLAGCASSRKTMATKEEWSARKDSTVMELLRVTAEPVPLSEVSLTLKRDSLLELPPGASYSAKSGRARVEVRAEPGTIVVTSSCDSLQRIVEYYERKIGEYETAVKGAREEQTGERTPLYAWRNLLTALTAGFIAGIVTTLKFK